ncbi:MAG: structural protein [Desulfovibrio sp.]|uniref:structural protein n=1 Tax=Desulfovibrio sp. 7SRBS1 TaxID=3378064 RepID=UPI003B3C5D55
MNIPRGIRNNNPGNIRHGENWNGLALEQLDPDFCTFVAPVYGIRAMGRILLNYQRRHHLNTVREIVNRWAPPVENNTEAYAAHVARALGVDPDEPVDVAALLETFLEVIIMHENGQNPYDASVLAQGADMARA